MALGLSRQYRALKPRQKGATIRRFGKPPEQGRKYTFRPGAYAILPQGRLYLATRQFGQTPEIQLAGGGIDPGEGPVQALHREVFEETGWRITQPRRLGAYKRFVYMPDYDLWAEKICHIYLARPVYKISDPTEPLHEAVLLNFDALKRQLANDGDRHFLLRYGDSG